MTEKIYIEERNGGLYIKDTRISLDSVVYAFNRGESAESIVQSFPSLTLDEVNGAINYYLANRKQVDEYLVEGEKQFEIMRQESRRQNPELYAKLEAFKQAQKQIKN